MSVGAICFTSSGGNGGCWVVLVSPPPLFFGKKGFFSPYATYAKKKVYATYTKNQNFRQKKRDLCQKKSYALYAKKKAISAYFHNRAALSSFGGGGGGCRSQRTNPHNIAQHINGQGDLENASRVFWIPKVHKPHPTNGGDRHGIRKVCPEKVALRTNAPS